jgi:hydroxyacylglutathione hydrolase
MEAIIPVRAFADNYIWMLRDGARAVAVDPGDAAPVVAFLERENLQLTAILATHHHRDHVGGVAELVRRYDARVFGPAREAIPGPVEPLAEGDRARLDAPGIDFGVLDIPGHTAGHIAYTGEFGGRRVLFCGDTLFAAGCGKLFEGTPKQMWTSLSKLAALPPDTVVYCGHEYTLSNLRFAAAVEPASRAIVDRIERERAKRERDLPTVPSTIGEELATNPFLRARVAAVREAAQRESERPLHDDVAVFATLREWKNRF